MTKERQLRKQEEIRTAILDAAREIIAKDGVQGLSIRKITNAIEYSPAIIYHYFRDKNEIVETLVNEGYKRILDTISSVKTYQDEPEREIKEVFTGYIKASLDNEDEYRAIMFSDSPAIRQRTAILEKGVSQRSRTMQVLCETIERGVHQGRFADCDIELTAQILWTSTFGLILKLMMEKGLPEEHMNELIEHHFQVLFHGIMKKKEE